VKLPKCSPCTKCKQKLCQIEWRDETEKEKTEREFMQRNGLVWVLVPKPGVSWAPRPPRSSR
jgi:hypothetical protein